MTHRRRRRYRPRIEVADSTLRPGHGSASGRIVCHFDGACAYPGGRAAYGAVIRRGGRVIWRASESVPDRGAGTSCNLAEYAGLVAVLRYLLAAGLNRERIVVIGDSQLVIRQMFGRWRIKSGCYVELAREAKRLLMQFPHIEGRWVPRARNSTADALSKAALTPHWRERQQVDWE
jgi:ribonuclease HI